ncbi:MAG: DUF3619 family protein [Rhodoferax sp.]
MTQPASLHFASNARADQFGARIARHLDEGCQQLERDIGERLRAARNQALAHRRVAVVVAAPAVLTQGNAATLGGRLGFWGSAASWLPLVALVVGLLGIGTLQEQMRAHEVADVDAELLTGDLPTAAYTDPGFAQYLKRAPKD